MKQAEHRLGIHEPYVMKRHLRLAETLSGSEAKLLVALDAAPGVAHAELDRKKRRLIVAYDASTQNLDGVVEVLQEQGVAMATDWWSRLRADWYRNTDANIHDNARREPWSCHKSPPR